MVSIADPRHPFHPKTKKGMREIFMAIVEFLFEDVIDNFLARIFGPSFKKLARADKFWTILTIILLLVAGAFLLMTIYDWLTA